MWFLTILPREMNLAHPFLSKALTTRFTTCSLPMDIIIISVAAEIRSTVIIP